MTSARGRRALSRVSSPSTSGGTRPGWHQQGVPESPRWPTCLHAQSPPPCRHALWLFLSPDRQMKSGVLLTYHLASPVQLRPNTSATMWFRQKKKQTAHLAAPSWSLPSGNCSPSTLTRARREMRPDSCASTTDSCAVIDRSWGGVR